MADQNQKHPADVLADSAHLSYRVGWRRQAEEMLRRILALEAERDRLLDALKELRDRIKDHPAYADLTVEQEIEEGGDTAEFSYLARVADEAIAATEPKETK